MTERLYYDDAYLWEFDATVTASAEGKTPGVYGITLDRSAFYPTSGGQPFDTGVIRFDGGEARVTDVEADRGGEVWHLTDRQIPVGTKVHCVIDGERRTDHMEQHGGEHMLAGAIWEKLKGMTIGLHLGAEESTIDVELPEGRTHLTDDEIRMLEDTVNERIRLDAPIRCWFPGKEELASLPLRKRPTVTEHVRIVAMGDFEMVACGGTHPSSTGRIGMIKIIGVIPAKGKARVSFVCGGRAAKLFRKYMACADKAGAALSSPVDKLSRAANELKTRLAEAERKARVYETAEILGKIRAAESRYDLRIAALSAVTLPEGDPKAVAAAVSEYIAEKGKILLLGVGERLTFARSADVKADMNELIRRVGRGGGRPDMASGAGIPECVGVARKILMTEMK
ncbi:MAG: alanyl-tRNA editing protein [Clostridiales bacterium]|nr:alanyl-tRNA editing protein [Clostridiales bacterium]